MPDLPDLSILTANLPSAILTFDGAAGYAIEGVTPSVVVRPATQAEVAATLGAANAAGASVVPFGGGTLQARGMPPARYDVALDLTRIDALVEHEPADLTVTVEAGMRLSTLQRLLGEKGQWLPLDPPVSDTATIGGVLATNASGPARLSRGTARDLVIGMTLATAGGELVKSGGRVVKNVAGYDMAKLHIGALGTLGVILQASFKVAPRPVRTATVIALGSLGALLRLSNAVGAARLPLQGAILARDAVAPPWRLGLRFAAGDAAVERSISEANALARAEGLTFADASDDGWRALQPDYASNAVVARATVLPTDLPPLLDSLLSAGAAVSALPGAGIAHAAWPAAPDAARLRSLRQACEGKRGALVIDQAPPDLKRAFNPWGSTRADFALMQRLKQELDPQCVLNPGRFVGGI